VQGDKPINDETLSEAIAATDNAVDVSKYCQPSFNKAIQIATVLGLSTDGITSNKELAELHPEYFSYNTNSRKLNYKPKPKT